MALISILEPHPSVPKSKRAILSTGRGGAGNFSSHDSSSLTDGPTATGPASRLSISSDNKKKQQQQQQQATDSSAAAAAATTATTTTFATGPRPSVAVQKKPSVSSAPKAYSGGIGGAGNFHSASDRRMFSFDEELERASRLERAKASVPVYHFGRGGAGNLASSVTDRKTSSSSAASRSTAVSGRAGSTSSGGSETSEDSRTSRRGFGSWIRGISTSRE